MKKTLITPTDVVNLAFGGATNLRPEDVSEATIVAAQRKYLLPVFGAAFMDEMIGNEHPDLVRECIAIALALYVKRLLLPVLAARVGMAGVVRYVGEGYTEVDEETFARLLRRTKADADAIVDTAVEFVELNAESYPSYRPADNVRHRVNIDSGIVL